MWLFPPWIHDAPKGSYQARGWYFVLDLTQGEGEQVGLGCAPVGIRTRAVRPGVGTL